MKTLVEGLVKMLGFLLRLWFWVVWGGMAGALAVFLWFPERAEALLWWSVAAGILLFVALGAGIELWKRYRWGENSTAAHLIRTLGQRLTIIVGVSLLLLVGAGMLRDFVENWQEARTSQNWETRTAEVVALPDDGVIHYTYNVRDIQYTGYRLTFYDTVTSRNSRAYARDNYQVGDTITIYYDPAAPGRSVVARTSPLAPTAFGGMACLLLIFGYLGVRFARRGLEKLGRPV